jgi:hypothetical protein
MLVSNATKFGGMFVVGDACITMAAMTQLTHLLTHAPDYDCSENSSAANAYTPS